MGVKRQRRFKSVDEYIAAQPAAVREDEIAPYFDHNSTLRFPLAQPVPVKLIERIAKFRAKDVSGRGKAKAAAPKPR